MSVSNQSGSSFSLLNFSSLQDTANWLLLELQRVEDDATDLEASSVVVSIQACTIFVTIVGVVALTSFLVWRSVSPTSLSTFPVLSAGCLLSLSCSVTAPICLFLVLVSDELLAAPGIRSLVFSHELALGLLDLSGKTCTVFSFIFLPVSVFLQNAMTLPESTPLSFRITDMLVSFSYYVAALSILSYCIGDVLIHAVGAAVRAWAPLRSVAVAGSTYRPVDQLADESTSSRTFTVIQVSLLAIGVLLWMLKIPVAIHRITSLVAPTLWANISFQCRAVLVAFRGRIVRAFFRLVAPPSGAPDWMSSFQHPSSSSSYDRDGGLCLPDAVDVVHSSCADGDGACDGRTASSLPLPRSLVSCRVPSVFLFCCALESLQSGSDADSMESPPSLSPSPPSQPSAADSNNTSDLRDAQLSTAASLDVPLLQKERDLFTLVEGSRDLAALVASCSSVGKFPSRCLDSNRVSLAAEYRCTCGVNVPQRRVPIACNPYVVTTAVLLAYGFRSPAAIHELCKGDANVLWSWFCAATAQHNGAVFSASLESPTARRSDVKSYPRCAADGTDALSQIFESSRDQSLPSLSGISSISRYTSPCNGDTKGGNPSSVRSVFSSSRMDSSSVGRSARSVSVVPDRSQQYVLPSLCEYCVNLALIPSRSVCVELVLKAAKLALPQKETSDHLCKLSLRKMLSTCVLLSITGIGGFFCCLYALSGLLNAIMSAVAVDSISTSTKLHSLAVHMNLKEPNIALGFCVLVYLCTLAVVGAVKPSVIHEYYATKVKQRHSYHMETFTMLRVRGMILLCLQLSLVAAGLPFIVRALLPLHLPKRTEGVCSIPDTSTALQGSADRQGPSTGWSDIMVHVDVVTLQISHVVADRVFGIFSVIHGICLLSAVFVSVAPVAAQTLLSGVRSCVTFLVVLQLKLLVRLAVAIWSSVVKAVSVIVTGPKVAVSTSGSSPNRPQSSHTQRGSPS